MSEQEPEHVVCPYCGGYGGFRVTHEMASDACEPEMEGSWWGCTHCNGGGLV